MKKFLLFCFSFIASATLINITVEPYEDRVIFYLKMEIENQYKGTIEPQETPEVKIELVDEKTLIYSVVVQKKQDSIERLTTVTIAGNKIELSYDQMEDSETCFARYKILEIPKITHLIHCYVRRKFIERTETTVTIPNNTENPQSPRPTLRPATPKLTKAPSFHRRESLPGSPVLSPNARRLSFAEKEPHSPRNPLVNQTESSPYSPANARRLSIGPEINTAEHVNPLSDIALSRMIERRNSELAMASSPRRRSILEQHLKTKNKEIVAQNKPALIPNNFIFNKVNEPPTIALELSNSRPGTPGVGSPRRNSLVNESISPKILRKEVPIISETTKFQGSMAIFLNEVCSITC